VRKPMPFKIDGVEYGRIDGPVGFPYPIVVGSLSMGGKFTPREAERLAKWLVKAADWVDSVKKRVGR